MKQQLLTFIKNNKLYFSVLFFAGAIVDILYYAFLSDSLFFVLFFSLVWFVFYFKLTSRDIIRMLFIFLCMLFVFYIVDKEAYHTERVVTWIFFLLIIVIAQQMLSFRNKK